MRLDATGVGGSIQKNEKGAQGPNMDLTRLASGSIIWNHIVLSGCSYRGGPGAVLVVATGAVLMVATGTVRDGPGAVLNMATGAARDGPGAVLVGREGRPERRTCRRKKA